MSESSPALRAPLDYTLSLFWCSEDRGFSTRKGATSPTASETIQDPVALPPTAQATSQSYSHVLRKECSPEERYPRGCTYSPPGPSVMSAPHPDAEVAGHVDRSAAKGELTRCATAVLAILATDYDRSSYPRTWRSRTLQSSRSSSAKRGGRSTLST